VSARNVPTAKTDVWGTHGRASTCVKNPVGRCKSPRASNPRAYLYELNLAVQLRVLSDAPERARRRVWGTRRKF